MNNENNIDTIISHYDKAWGNISNIFLHDKGPMEKLDYSFRIIEYPPTTDRKHWTYATCNMGKGFNSEQHIELHIFSSIKDRSFIELLTTVAYYHRNTHGLGLNHTINFGKSWQESSLCSYGLISKPYIDGPIFERLNTEQNDIRCCWLIPITLEEVDYKKRHGVEALEAIFEKNSLDYLNANRTSLV